MKPISIFSKKSKVLHEEGLIIYPCGTNSTRRLMLCKHELDSLVLTQNIAIENDLASKVALKLHLIYTNDDYTANLDLAIFIDKKEYIKEVKEKDLITLINECDELESVTRARLIILILSYWLASTEVGETALANLIKNDATYRCIDYLSAEALRELYSRYMVGENVVDFNTLNKLIVKLTKIGDTSSE